MLKREHEPARLAWEAELQARRDWRAECEQRCGELWAALGFVPDGNTYGRCDYAGRWAPPGSRAGDTNPSWDSVVRAYEEAG